MRLLLLLILAGALSLVERLWPERRGQRRLRPGVGTDLVYLLIMPLLTRAATLIGVVAVLVMVTFFLDAPLGRATWVSGLPLGLQAVMVLFAADFFGYWMHRAFHHEPFWRVHAIHHSSTELDWLSAARVHPLNAVITRSLQVGVLVPLGFDPRVLLGAAPLFALYGILLHANVRWSFGPLRWVFASPAFHRWHHAADVAGPGKNFAGLFPVWDLLFGTFHMPVGEHPERYGVHGEAPPAGVLAQLAYPFRRTVR